MKIRLLLNIEGGVLEAQSKFHTSCDRIFLYGAYRFGNRNFKNLP
jgi:hypothetical protein